VEYFIEFIMGTHIMHKYFSTFAYLIIITNILSGAVTTIDFETDGDGYTPSGTEGSGWEDVFNRTNHNMTIISNEDGYYWAAEDMSAGNPYLTLDQISVSGASSFVLQLDAVVHHYNDMDQLDEFKVTYQIDGGSSQNLLWFQSTPGSSTNTNFAIDTDFDGDGECGAATTLSHRSAGTIQSCTSTSDGFQTYTSPVVALSSNSTLDIKLQWFSMTAGDEGLYIDNIIVTTDPEKCTIAGNSGFRMMSSPVAGTIYSDLLNELWTQGVTGGDVTDGSTANIWSLNSYSGTQSWTEFTDISTSGASLNSGEGFLVYVFSDTDWDGDDDLPVTLSVAGKLNSGSVTFPNSGTIAASKYGLAGNPYNATIDFDLIDLTNIEDNISVWDDANSDWKTWDKSGQTGDLSNGLIAPYQGFWVQATSSGSGSVGIQTSDKSGTGTFYRTVDDEERGSISILSSTSTSTSENFISFHQDAVPGDSGLGAKKLLPFQASSRMVSMSIIEEQPYKINELPFFHDEMLIIPYDVMDIELNENNFITQSSEVILSWNIEELPDHISIILIDEITGQQIYLNQESEYVFTTIPKGSFSAIYDGPVSTYPLLGDPRFTMQIIYGALDNGLTEVMPTDYALSPIYPNPFNPSTTVHLYIPQVSRVGLQVYDVKGALVETLLNDMMSPGQHQFIWNPQELSTGIYFLRLTAANQTFTQKVTYVK